MRDGTLHTRCCLRLLNRWRFGTPPRSGRRRLSVHYAEFSEMFESLDEGNPSVGPSGSPTLVVAAVFGALAWALASLLGSSGKSGAALILAFSLIFSMSSEWHKDDGWRFWTISASILVLDSCLVVLVPWPAMVLDRGILPILLVCDTLIDLGIFALLRKRSKGDSECGHGTSRIGAE